MKKSIPVLIFCLMLAVACENKFKTKAPISAAQSIEIIKNSNSRLSFQLDEFWPFEETLKAGDPTILELLAYK